MYRTIWDTATGSFHMFLDVSEDMSMTQWAVVAVILVVVGTLCMRGFGSRTDY